MVDCGSFNPSLCDMATENCISDCALPQTGLRGRPGKRKRISAEANLPIRKRRGRPRKLTPKLIEEILIRLPNPRSVSRCKLVCKRWNSLISSPRFNRRFVSHHQTMNHRHMPVDPRQLRSIILSFLPPMPASARDDLRVLDCNKDLLLCGFSDIGCEDGERSRTYLVCNPFTKQWIALPLAPRKHGPYMLPAARLVCEPLISNKLYLGGKETLVYSEYRFQVVCIYQVCEPKVAIKLDVFCSESGEWTKEVVICDDHVRTGSKSVVSCNGELFWKYIERSDPSKVLLAVFNPFGLDMPPTPIDASAFLVYPHWFISASQGVLHVITIENETTTYRSSVWRLEEDRKSWTKQRCILMAKQSLFSKSEGCYQPFLHPHKSEIVFFYRVPYQYENFIICCDMGRRKIELVAKVEGPSDILYFQMFQPKVSGWATPIPRYEELRGMYDGNYSFWVQSSSEAKTHSPPLTLTGCMDDVMKSALYNDYLDVVTEEGTLKMVAEIIHRRKKGIREIVIREKQQHCFPFDKEMDVLDADLKDVEAEMAAIDKRKEELKERLVCEMSAELPYPPAGNQRDQLEVPIRASLAIAGAANSDQKSRIKIAGHCTMATENCISDCDRGISELHHRPVKRRRISSEANLPPMTISELGADLLVEILIRLPNPRSASQCKLVCKRWASLISSPRFNRCFVSHHQTRNHPHMPANPYDLKSIILNFLPPMACRVRNALRVLDCNKDLVLCGFWDVDCDDGEHSRTYLVCNPFTKQWIALPLAPRKHVGYISPAARYDEMDYLVNNPAKDLVAVFNPFRLDMPPTAVDASAFRAYPHWFISGSQGVLHAIAIENKTVPVRLSIWRLEEDCKSWRKQCEGLVNETSKCCNYQVESCYRPILHPHKPGIVFFNALGSEEKTAILCCDLRTQELELVAKVEGKSDVCRLQVFQPTVSCWATLIPRYEELRGLYDGNYSFWVQSSSEVKTHSLHPSLNICKDEVMQSGFYEDYISNVSEKLTMDIVAEIMQRRRNKIRKNVLRGRQFDKELDAPETVLKHIDAHMVTIGKQTEEVKRILGLMWEKSARVPYPPDFVKSVSAEVTRDVVAEIIERSKNKISESYLRESYQPHFPHDKEADLKDVESYLDTIGYPQQLKQGDLCETSAELPHPLVTMKREMWKMPLKPLTEVATGNDEIVDDKMHMTVVCVYRAVGRADWAGHESDCGSFNPSLCDMATENCISDCALPQTGLRGRPGKRKRISAEANLPIRKSRGRPRKLTPKLIEEILIRLPNPRSASRSKLVCKRWNSLISSPRFNRRFVSHHQTMNHRPMPFDTHQLRPIMLSFLPPMPASARDDLRVLDCNKDLLLCGFSDIGCEDGERSRTYLVCNPFTKQWIALPLAPRKHGPYMLPAARLVCEPLISNKLYLGGKETLVYSEYRFQVVCIYQVCEPKVAIKLDVFCSQSGEWTKEVVICDDHVRTGSKSVVSCNGELFWKYIERSDPSKVLLAVFNPFRLDMPPTPIDASAFLVYPHWFISASQGVLNVITIENETAAYRSSVWRLEEDRKSWTKQRWILLAKQLVLGEYDGCYQPFLHPHKPEIVFFYRTPYKYTNFLMSCDMGRRKLELVAKVESPQDVLYLQMFQPKVSGWATPIPRYEELRGMYDGNYSFWVQGSSEAKTHSPPLTLTGCMVDVMKSALYNDYLDVVTEEGTLKMVAEIIHYRKEGICEIVIREREQHRFPFDKEMDVLDADLKDVEAEMAAIGKRKEELKERLVCEMSAELPYPPAGNQKDQLEVPIQASVTIAGAANSDQKSRIKIVGHCTMATENCISDCDRRISELHRLPGKRRRISSEANLPPMTISELGADLLVEILIRLPNPRSASQCKLVCKPWASLISSPRFNRCFVSHHQTRNHPHMPANPYDLKSIILNFLPPMPCRVRNALRVLDCNKDLVLCGFWDVDCDDGENSRTYLVCNPFTKQWIALPLAPRKHVGYISPAARLVCEPLISKKLDLGDGQSFVFSEYRFRVVCIYQVVDPKIAIKLDVFCSDSGEWTKDALVCDGHVKIGIKCVISCNGELFWRYDEMNYMVNNPAKDLVAVFNPFRLDLPPTAVDASAFRAYRRWFISGSQGVLHAIAIENKTVPVRLSIWRLEEDCKSWRKQCEVLVNETSKCCNYQVESCYRPLLHPHKPEIVLFNALGSEEKNAILSCDLRTQELELVAKVEGKPDVCRLQVFQPRVPFWATLIPRYEELRGLYDGNYSFWVQSSREVKTHSLHRSLNICKDEVMQSGFFEDYISNVNFVKSVSAEVTRDVVAEITERSKNKISESYLRESYQPHFPHDKEADLKDVESYMDTIGYPQQLKKGQLCETSAELPLPLVTMKSEKLRFSLRPYTEAVPGRTLKSKDRLLANLKRHE
ncbi:Putative F-box/kelch-repeat protein At1g15680 [Linum grandiflorum]